jgi:tetratricopeptide (TPR) repeat protein
MKSFTSFLLCCWAATAIPAQVPRDLEKRLAVIDSLFRQEAYYEALPLAEALVEDHRNGRFAQALGSAYNYIGISRMELGDFDPALEAFTRAVQHRQNQRDWPGVARVYNNLATLFDYQVDWEKALYYSDKALGLGGRGCAPDDLARIYVNRGNIWPATKRASTCCTNRAMPACAPMRITTSALPCCAKNASPRPNGISTTPWPFLPRSKTNASRP